MFYLISFIYSLHFKWSWGLLKLMLYRFFQLAYSVSVLLHKTMMCAVISDFLDLMLQSNIYQMCTVSSR